MVVKQTAPANSSIPLVGPMLSFWASCLLILAFGARDAMGDVIHVPGDYSTIQLALDSAAISDTVVVSAGEYIESLTLPTHEMTLASNYLFTQDSSDIAQCVVRPPNGGRTLFIPADSSRARARFIGLTIRGGQMEPGQSAGGLQGENRQIELRHCRLDSSYAAVGGIARVQRCTLNIVDCRLENSRSFTRGMAIYATNSSVWLERSSIINLLCDDESGDAIAIDYGTLRMYGCTIAGSGMDQLPGMRFARFEGLGCSTEVKQCLITENRFQQFFEFSDDAPRQEPLIVVFDSNTVTRNEFQRDILSSDALESGSSAQFIGNRFIENHRISDGNWICRMFFTMALQTCRWTVQGNLFLRNEAHENSVAGIGAPLHPQNSFYRNYILEDSCDGFSNPPGGIIMMINCPAGMVTENTFSQSHGYAAFQGLEARPPSHAPNNYWGHASGPRQISENPEGLGDSVEALVTVTPWYADTSFLALRDHNRFLDNAPHDFLIGFAYPNPFNASITIEFVTTKREQVQLQIFDLTGRLVSTLAQEELDIGIHRRVWPADNNASGLYFARLSSPNSEQRPWLTKLVLMK